MYIFYAHIYIYIYTHTQAGVGLVGSALGGGPALSRTFHRALEGSVARHFPGNHAINCMCHSTENLYRCVPVCVCV